MLTNNNIGQALIYINIFPLYLVFKSRDHFFNQHHNILDGLIRIEMNSQIIGLINRSLQMYLNRIGTFYSLYHFFEWTITEIQTSTSPIRIIRSLHAFSLYMSGKKLVAKEAFGGKLEYIFCGGAYLY